MLRKMVFGLAIVAGLGLSGCATTGGVPAVVTGGGGTPVNVQNAINEVKAVVAQACNIVPTGDTILNLVNATGILGQYSDVATGVDAVARMLESAICPAGPIAPQSVRLGAIRNGHVVLRPARGQTLTFGRIHGVVIRGTPVVRRGLSPA